MSDTPQQSQVATKHVRQCSADGCTILLQKRNTTPLCHLCKKLTTEGRKYHAAIVERARVRTRMYNTKVRELEDMLSRLMPAAEIQRPKKGRPFKNGARNGAQNA